MARYLMLRVPDFEYFAFAVKISITDVLSSFVRRSQEADLDFSVRAVVTAA
jgi:hypothetical protein